MLYPIENKIREVKSLDGIWRFKIDKKNCGLEERWYQEPLRDTIPMAVPASYNDMMTETDEKDHVGYVWYETNFSIPDSWQGKRIVLRFGSATHHATVWVDGQKVVYHKGGFLPFEADITSVLEAAPEAETFRLTLALSNVLDWGCLPCGEIVERSGPNYPEGYHYQDTNFDFYNYSGIHRPVRLYTTPKNYISDILIKTDLKDDHSGVSVSCVITGTDTIKRMQIIDEEGNVAAEACDTCEAVMTIQNPHLWQPGKAYLYRLRVEGEQDLYTEEFGVRSVKVTDKEFLINGKPFYFQGFGKHEDSDIHGKGLDNALNVKDFALLKWMGANSFRTSHYPYAEELMRLADREGFVLIDETPAVGMHFFRDQKVFDGTKVNEETFRHHMDCIRDMYNRDKNHPCVVMWCVANEADTREKSSARYFKPIIDFMRELDDTRPLTMVQNNELADDIVGPWLDVICLNRYYSWYPDHSHLEVVEMQAERELLAWYETYHKPIMMTEYGADTIPGLHKWPPVTFSEEYQCEVLNRYHNAFDRLDFFVGEHVWAFADFQTKQGINRIDGNKKGVFTRDRRPKMAAHLLRNRWIKKSTEE